jgi:uncharacterized protein YndB with AHSA1/START domain
MESTLTSPITIETIINEPLAKVWDYWTQPKHICNWCFADESWHAPKAENDLKVGGKFLTRMEAKDQSFGFDFEGVYTRLEQHHLIEYILADQRKVLTQFKEEGDLTRVIETFDAESENSLEMQKAGWQAILNNFKKYCGTA